MSKHVEVPGVPDKLVDEVLRPIQNAQAARAVAGEGPGAPRTSQQDGARDVLLERHHWVPTHRLREVLRGYGSDASPVRRGGKEREQLLKAIVRAAVLQLAFQSVRENIEAAWGPRWGNSQSPA